jgi:hypothetical protein
MSADNFMNVDHDGENFLVYHGFMSSVGEEDEDGNIYEPRLVAAVKTEQEVYNIIDDYAIIEYGVDWTHAARIACCGGNMTVDNLEFDQADLDNRFTYHYVKDDQPERYVELRNNAKDLAELICDLCPVSRERSLAITNLEQAIFWANASIARNE